MTLQARGISLVVNIATIKCVISHRRYYMLITPIMKSCLRLATLIAIFGVGQAVAQEELRYPPPEEPTPVETAPPAEVQSTAAAPASTPAKPGTAVRQPARGYGAPAPGVYGGAPAPGGPGPYGAPGPYGGPAPYGGPYGGAPGYGGPGGYGRPYGGGYRNGPWGGNNGPWGNMFGNRGGPWGGNNWFGGRDNPFGDPGSWFDPSDPKEGMAQMWDDLLNAPSEMGEMPPGWTAPSISVPNPIDVGDQLEEASQEIGPDMIQLR